MGILGLSGEDYKAGGLLSSTAGWLLYDIQNDGAYASVGSINSAGGANVKWLDTDKYVFSYRDSSGYPVVRIADVSSGVTLGTAVTLLSASSDVIAIYVVSSTEFVVRTETNIHACSVSGTTITEDDEEADAADGSILVQGNTTKSTFVELWGDGVNAIDGRHITLSSGTLTLGTTATSLISTNSGSTNLIGATVEDGVAIVCIDSGTSNADIVAAEINFNEDGSSTPSGGSTATIANPNSSSVSAMTYYNRRRFDGGRMPLAVADNGDVYGFMIYNGRTSVGDNMNYAAWKWDTSAGTVNALAYDQALADVRNQPYSYSGLFGVHEAPHSSMSRISNTDDLHVQFEMPVGGSGSQNFVHTRFCFTKIINEGFPIMMSPIFGAYDEVAASSSNPVVGSAALDLAPDLSTGFMVYNFNSSCYYKEIAKPTA